MTVAEASATAKTLIHMIFDRRSFRHSAVIYHYEKNQNKYNKIVKEVKQKLEDKIGLSGL